MFEEELGKDLAQEKNIVFLDKNNKIEIDENQASILWNVGECIHNYSQDILKINKNKYAPLKDLEGERLFTAIESICYQLDIYSIREEKYIMHQILFWIARNPTDIEDQILQETLHEVMELLLPTKFIEQLEKITTKIKAIPNYNWNYWRKESLRSIQSSCTINPPKMATPENINLQIVILPGKEFIFKKIKRNIVKKCVKDIDEKYQDKELRNKLKEELMSKTIKCSIEDFYSELARPVIETKNDPPLPPEIFKQILQKAMNELLPDNLKNYFGGLQKLRLENSEINYEYSKDKNMQIYTLWLAIKIDILETAKPIFETLKKEMEEYCLEKMETAPSYMDPDDYESMVYEDVQYEVHMVTDCLKLEEFYSELAEPFYAVKDENSDYPKDISKQITQEAMEKIFPPKLWEFYHSMQKIQTKNLEGQEPYSFAWYGCSKKSESDKESN